MASEGWPLNTSLSQTKVFPPMVCNLTGIGEETGDLQAMMEKTADYYDEEVEAATQKLLSMMEPIIMLFLVGFVLILVLAIFLPMLNMNSAYDQYL
jgi:type IV pilus assembly protein PilC